MQKREPTTMRSQPAAMAKAAKPGPTPLSGCLPEEIVIWEILVRLPPKNLVRCRAVCRAWRRITSTRHFLLAHHGHQPSLPLLSGYESDGDYDCHLEIIVFDHRAATAAAQLQPLARLDSNILSVEASCDGLLVMSIACTYYFVCNPLTRQWGDIDILCGFYFSGIYPHHHTGQYRLLMYRSQSQKLMFEGLVPGDEDAWYVLALGCDQVPRCIGWPEVEFHGTPVLVRGSLHWYPAEHHTRSRMILAFDTTAESFRLMRAPVVAESTHPFETHMFEIDGMLGMYWHDDAKTTVDIWVMQDYESEVWAFKYRVELPVAEIKGQFEWSGSWHVMVASVDGNVLVLVCFDQWLLHIDSEGKLVASFRHDDNQGLWISSHQLKQSLVKHTFFPALDDYKVDALPFI